MLETCPVEHLSKRQQRSANSEREKTGIVLKFADPFRPWTGHCWITLESASAQTESFKMLDTRIQNNRLSAILQT